MGQAWSTGVTVGLALAGLQIGGNGGRSDSNTVEYDQTITMPVPPGQMVCVPPLFLFFHSDCKLITYSFVVSRVYWLRWCNTIARAGPCRLITSKYHPPFNLL